MAIPESLGKTLVYKRSARLAVAVNCRVRRVRRQMFDSFLRTT